MLQNTTQKGNKLVQRTQKNAENTRRGARRRSTSLQSPGACWETDWPAWKCTAGGPRRSKKSKKSNKSCKIQHKKAINWFKGGKKTQKIGGRPAGLNQPGWCNQKRTIMLGLLSPAGLPTIFCVFLLPLNQFIAFLCCILQLLLPFLLFLPLLGPPAVHFQAGQSVSQQASGGRLLLGGRLTSLKLYSWGSQKKQKKQENQ